MKSNKIYKSLRWIKYHPVKSGIWFFSIILLIPLVITLSIDEPGQIGDIFGGMTAPFINLLAAILVYISFNEQRKANKQQWRALKEDRQRIEKQSKFEILYRFYSEEIKNYKFPHDRDIIKCFKELNTNSDSIDFLRDNVKINLQIILNYLSLHHYYCVKLNNEFLNSEDKISLIILYINIHNTYRPFLKFPIDDSFFQENYNFEYTIILASIAVWDKDVKKLKDYLKSENLIETLFP